MRIQDIQPKIWDRLLRIKETNRIGSAYLFSGSEGCGKEWAALRFAALLNCTGSANLPCGKCPSCAKFKTLQHPNLKIIVPLPGGEKSGSRNKDPLDGLKKEELDYLTSALINKGKDGLYKISVPRAKRILLASVRELRHSIMLKSQENGQKVILIFEAHFLSSGVGESANALLKILEEPPSNTTLILVTDYKSELLPTIISRCQQIHFPALSTKTVTDLLIKKGIESTRAEFAAGISRGNIHRAVALSEQSPDEVQSQTDKLVKQVVRNSAKGWKSVIDSLSMTAARKPDDFRFQIYLLQLWFHYAKKIRGGKKYPSPFPDLNDFEKFNKAYPSANLAAINQELEYTIESLGQNLYTPLTLVNLLLSIQDYLQGKDTVSTR